MKVDGQRQHAVINIYGNEYKKKTKEMLEKNILRLIQVELFNQQQQQDEAIEEPGVWIT
jgi:hypothetical protein